MGGTYTNSRFPVEHRWEAHTKVVGSVNHDSFVTNEVGTYKAIQTTTSYRTGRPPQERTLEDDQEDFLLRKQPSAGDRFSIYRSQHDASGADRPYDRGHSFSTSTKFSLHRMVRTQNLGVGVDGYTVDYDGPVVHSSAYQVGSSPWYGTDPPAINSWYGTQAINACRPTNPNVDLAVTLAELYREGLPHTKEFGRVVTDERVRLRSELRQARYKAKRPDKVAAGENLAIQFGWLPFASAVQDMAKTLVSTGDILDQFARDEGRLIRRSFQFPETTTVVPLYEGSAGRAALPSNTSAVNKCWIGTGGSNGSRSEYLVKKESYRFSGAFMYKLPSDSESWGRLRRRAAEAQRLFGFKLTPEVVWNLAPWSWLADWHWNFGNVLSNAESLASDGLVLAWGYVTRKARYVHHIDITGANLNGYGPQCWPSQYVNESTTRLRANPYGFSSNPNSYTARQWSILGSLGLTKAPNSLH